MNINAQIEALYESCKTGDELRRELVKLLDSAGMPSDRWLNATINGLFGGTTVYLQSDGQYANKWRRKFQEPIDIEEREKLAA